jgi:hypothetical protein
VVYISLARISDLIHQGENILFGLLKDVIIFFRDNIRSISILTLYIEFPYLLVQNFEYFTELPAGISFLLSVIVFAAIFLIYPLSTGAQISLYYKIINGANLDLKQCISESKKHLTHLVIGTFIYLLLTLLGLIVFIIPGIVIGVRLSFYGFLIVYENYQPLDALRASYQITKGSTWQIANPLLVLGIPIVVINILIQGFFIKIDLYNIFSGTIIDLFFSIVGWLGLILIFRFYCLYKDKGRLIPH